MPRRRDLGWYRSTRPWERRAPARHRGAAKRGWSVSESLCVGVLTKKERAPKMNDEEKQAKKLERGEEERRRGLVRELLKMSGRSQEAIFGPGGLMKELSKALVEEALAGEMEHHLGYG